MLKKNSKFKMMLLQCFEQVRLLKGDGIDQTKTWLKKTSNKISIQLFIFSLHKTWQIISWLFRRAPITAMFKCQNTSPTIIQHTPITDKDYMHTDILYSQPHKHHMTISAHFTHRCQALTHTSMDKLTSSLWPHWTAVVKYDFSVTAPRINQASWCTF